MFVVVLTAMLIAGCSTADKKAEPSAEQTAAQEAIAAAKASLKKAASVGGEWRDSKKVLKKAQAAYDKGDYAKAIKLANQAKRQGELGYKQAQEEQARFDAKQTAKVDSYTVADGDSLLGISGKLSVYSDPYLWPLILSANRDKIKDADLIYPGQVFSINRTASDADIKAAIKHGKARGTWSVGEVEASDLDYLGR